MKALFIPKAPGDPYFQEVSEDSRGRAIQVIKDPMQPMPFSPVAVQTVSVATFEPRGSMARADGSFLFSIFEEI